MILIVLIFKKIVFILIMAYINRLTDINMNLMNINDKQLTGNTKLNNINGNLDSILTSSNNILTTLNSTINVNDNMTHTYLNTISTNLTGTLNSAIFGNNGTTNTQVKVDTLGNISSISYQLGSYANGIDNGSIDALDSSGWFDITDYTYIVAYYEDTKHLVSDDISVEFSFTDDELSLIIPNIIINLVNNGTKRYGRIDKLDVPGIKYIRIRNESSTILTNVYFTITGCK
jgi:hypothetical protein